MYVNCKYLLFLYFKQKFKGLFKPTEEWGPKSPRNKLEWTKYITEREMDEVLSS